MKAAFRTAFESLEHRHLMAADCGVSAVLDSSGLLKISATDDSVAITVERRNSTISVLQAEASFAVNKVKGIEVELSQGGDLLQFKYAGKKGAWIGVPVTVRPGQDNDVFENTNGKKLYFGGEDDALTINKQGTVKIAGRKPDWFDEHVIDTTLRDRARELATDKLLDRQDMIDLFDKVPSNEMVGEARFDSLQTIVANTKFYKNLDYVQQLSSNVVNGSVANFQYLGQPLGNLAIDSEGSQLESLVDKWFLGLDHPDSMDKHGETGTYEPILGSLFDGAPNMHQINQGADGDCYFLSGMESIAIHNPQVIEDMFIVNGDGTYTVRFYNEGKPVYVTIDSMLPVVNGHLQYDDDQRIPGNSSNILWSAFAEKAYCQLAELGWSRPTAQNNAYMAIDSGNAATVMMQITGRKAEKQCLCMVTAKDVIKAFQNDRPVTFGSKDSPVASDVEGNHDYALVGYDASTGKFTLFNPWGFHQHHHNPPKPALIEKTWDEIKANYLDWHVGSKV
jgi:hypothetical protein